MKDPEPIFHFQFLLVDKTISELLRERKYLTRLVKKGMGTPTSGPISDFDFTSQEPSFTTTKCLIVQQCHGGRQWNYPPLFGLQWHPKPQELSMISPPLNVNIYCLRPLSNIFFLSHSVQFQVSISVIWLTWQYTQMLLELIQQCSMSGARFISSLSFLLFPISHLVISCHRTGRLSGCPYFP